MSLQVLTIILVGTLLAPLSSAQNPIPTSSVTGVFQLPGPHIPHSLEASVITSYDISTVGFSPTFVVSYLAACPSASSPENDACRSLSLYPAEMYHTQGSVWGGVMTNRREERTSSWECSLGGCQTCTGNMARKATCHSTVVGEGGKTLLSDSRVLSEPCELLHASVPLVVTAGVEKLRSYSWRSMLTDVVGHLSAYAKDASAIHCPPRPTLAFNSAATTASATLSSLPTSITSGATPTGKRSGAASDATGVTATIATSTATALASSPSAGAQGSISTTVSQGTGGKVVVGGFISWLGVRVMGAFGVI